MKRQLSNNVQQLGWSNKLQLSASICLVAKKTFNKINIIDNTNYHKYQKHNKVMEEQND